MSQAAPRDLRNHTAEILRRVADGDRVTQGLPVVTHDDDFDPIEAVGGPEIIRV